MRGQEPALRPWTILVVGVLAAPEHGLLLPQDVCGDLECLESRIVLTADARDLHGAQPQLPSVTAQTRYVLVAPEQEVDVVPAVAVPGRRHADVDERTTAPASDPLLEGGESSHEVLTVQGRTDRQVVRGSARCYRQRHALHVGQWAAHRSAVPQSPYRGPGRSLGMVREVGRREGAPGCVPGAGRPFCWGSRWVATTPGKPSQAFFSGHRARPLAWDGKARSARATGV